MEGAKGGPRILSIEKFGGYKTEEVKEIIEGRERQALRSKVEEEKHLEIYGGLREDIGKNVSARSNGLREIAKLRVRVGDLDLPERRKRFTSSRKEDMATNMCPCGTTTESRTHIVGECGIFKEEQDALEEVRKLDACDMGEFGRP